MTEIWKDIEGYEGAYQVSSLGRVKGLTRKFYGLDPNGKACVKWKKEKIHRQHESRKGYLTVTIQSENKKKTFSVHRLVAMAFCAGFAEGLTVDHIDQNKKNNVASNLEWCTNEENLKRSHDYGTHSGFIEKPKRRVLSRAQIDEINRLYYSEENLAAANPWVKPYSQRKIAKMFNVSQDTIKQAVRGKVKGKDE